MLRRLGVAALVVGLLTAACGSAAPTQLPTDSQAPGATGQPTATGQATASGQPTQTQQPTTTDAPPSTTDPTSTGEPAPTGEPLPPDGSAIVLNPPAPLPDPELESVEEIVQDFFEPGLEDQAVMSMLDQLGIGVYSDDGKTVILAGSDTREGDFYISESEARGLISMLQSAGLQPWINFTDLYDGYVALGLQSSAEELAQAYNDAYAAAPDEPVTQFVQANAFIQTDAQVSPLGVWLMLLDGMIPPNGSTQAMALRTGVGAPIARGRAGWGAAQSNVQGLNWNNLQQAMQTTARSLQAQAMAQSAQITINPPSQVHEGHGGNTGTPTTVTAVVKPCPSSAYSGSCSVPYTASLGGINVTWTFDGSLTSHGTPSVPSGSTTPTGPNGAAQFTYTPNRETPDASRNGYDMRAVSTVQASVPRAQIIQQIYGLPAQAAAFLGGSGSATYSEPMIIEWHEPEALRVELLNPYDVTIRDLVYGGTGTQKGTDTIKGDLVLDNDGVTYRGIMIGHAKGSFRGQFLGKSCSMSWDSTQLLQTVATVDPSSNEISFTFVPVDAPTGLPRGRCRPTIWKSEDSGVYFAPYNDYAVITPSGLHFQLFPAPDGGDADYPVPPGPSNVTIRNTLWHVHEEYLDPRP